MKIKTRVIEEIDLTLSREEANMLREIIRNSPNKSEDSGEHTSFKVRLFNFLLPKETQEEEDEE